MTKIDGNPYFKLLYDEYHNERIENAKSAYFKDWAVHKFRHSIEVTNAGVEIMDREPTLKALDDKIKEAFVSALLLHDLGRVREVNPDTGEYLKFHHAIEGARKVLESSCSDLNIIIPIMVHSSIDDAFVELKEGELIKSDRFLKLSDADRDFVLKMNGKFWQCDEETRKIICLGVGLVKDADKAANLTRFEGMFALSTNSKEIKLSPKTLKQLFDGGLMVTGDLKTVLDEVLSIVAWFNDIYFKATRDILIERDVLGEVRKYAASLCDNKTEIMDIFDEAIEFVKNKMPKYL